MSRALDDCTGCMPQQHRSDLHRDIFETSPEIVTLDIEALVL